MKSQNSFSIHNLRYPTCRVCRLMNESLFSPKFINDFHEGLIDLTNSETQVANHVRQIITQVHLEENAGAIGDSDRTLSMLELSVRASEFPKDGQNTATPRVYVKIQGVLAPLTDTQLLGGKFVLYVDVDASIPMEAQT